MRMSHFNKIDVQKWLQDRRFSNYRVSPEKKSKWSLLVRNVLQMVLKNDHGEIVDLWLFLGIFSPF